MSDKPIKTDRTWRILGLFEMLMDSGEVSWQELSDDEKSSAVRSCSRKTMLRDMKVLLQCGYNIKWGYNPVYENLFAHDGTPEPRRKTFWMEGTREPNYPQDTAERLYIEKILRLTTMMTNPAGFSDNPVVWYEKTYPELSKRTRERDFAELNDIGYQVAYQSVYDSENEKDVRRWITWASEY
jgi:hypothetical protein